MGDFVEVIMIKQVDDALAIWGEEFRRRGEAGYKCPLGSAVSTLGVKILPTDSSASRALYTGELGTVGEAVEDALVSIQQRPEDGGMGATGAALVKLARIRYLTDPMPIVPRQMRRMGWKSERTYNTKLQELHAALEPMLADRLPWMRCAAG